MKDKVRVGVISTSWWADLMYFPSLKSHPQADLVAICGRDQERAAEMAGKYEVPQIYTDYRQMIETADLDAVVVASPDDQHFTMTMDALDAGLHTLCEKPLALNVFDAQAMYEKASSSGVKNMVLFTNRWLAGYRFARDLIQQGYVGRCYHCEFHHKFGYARNPVYLWRYDQDRANGVLGDLGVHMIDMALWMLGDITRVSANLSVCVKRPGADGGLLNPANDSALLLIDFASGTHGIIQASAVNHLGDGILIKIYGEEGTLEMGDEIFGAQNQAEQLEKLEIPEEYLLGLDPSEQHKVFLEQSAGPRAFIDSILMDHPSTPDFYDGFKAQQVLQAALDSHRMKKAMIIG